MSILSETQTCIHTRVSVSSCVYSSLWSETTCTKETCVLYQMFIVIIIFYFVGKSPFGFADEANLLEDGSLDQTVPNMSSPSRGSPNSQSGLERIERFSRKVFVGGLPPDIDEGRHSTIHLFLESQKIECDENALTSVSD